MRRSNILSSGAKKGGIIRFGNFGNLLNASVYSNDIMTSLINTIKTETTGLSQQEAQTTTQLLIDNSNPIATCNQQIATTADVNYNQFYNVYYQLQQII